MRKFILIISLFFIFIFGMFGCSDIGHVHSENKDYTSVFVQVGSGRTLEDYSGTMSVIDYEKWKNGEDGTVFIYTDKKAKYGARLNISTITKMTNYGMIPYSFKDN